MKQNKQPNPLAESHGLSKEKLVPIKIWVAPKMKRFYRVRAAQADISMSKFLGEQLRQMMDKMKNSDSLPQLEVRPAMEPQALTSPLPPIKHPPVRPFGSDSKSSGR